MVFEELSCSHPLAVSRVHGPYVEDSLTSRGREDRRMEERKKGGRRERERESNACQTLGIKHQLKKINSLARKELTAWWGREVRTKL